MEEDDRQTDGRAGEFPRHSRWREIRWRRIAAVGGTVLAVLVVVLLFAPSLIDWTPYRVQIAALAGRASGLEIRLDGPISLHLLPRPAFRVERLSTGADAPFEAEVGALEVVLDWRALFRGRFAARTIRLVNPQVRIDDPLALNRWWTTRAEMGAKREGGEEEAPRELPRRFEVSDGRLLLAEPEGGRIHRFDIARLFVRQARPARSWRMDFEGALDDIPVDLHIEGGRRHDDGNMAVKATFDLAGTSFAYSGRVRSGVKGGLGGLTIAEADGRFEVRARSPAGLIAAGRVWSSRPPLRASDLPTILKAPIEARAHLRLDGHGVRFEEIRARLDKGRLDGRIAIALAPFTVRLALECDRLDLADIWMAAGDPDRVSQEPTTPFRLAARWQWLQEHLASLPGVVEAELTVRALRWRDLLTRDARLAMTLGNDQWIDLRFDADLPGGGHGSLVAAAPGPGKSAPALVGTLRLGLPSLAALTANAKDDADTAAGRAPHLPFDRLETSLGWRWKGAKVTVDPFRAALDGRAFDGRLSYAEPGGTHAGQAAENSPRLTIKLSGENLPVEPALLPSEAGRRALWSPRRLIDRLSDLTEALPAWEIKMDIALKRIAGADLPLEDLQAVLRHRAGGRLELAHLGFRRGGVEFLFRDGVFEELEGDRHIGVAGELKAYRSGALVELFALDPDLTGVLPEQVGGRFDLRRARLDLSLALADGDRRVTLDGSLIWDEVSEKERGAAHLAILPARLAKRIVPPDRIDLGWQINWRDAAPLVRLLPPGGWHSLIKQAAARDGRVDLGGRLVGPTATPRLVAHGHMLGARTELDLAALTGQRRKNGRTWKLYLTLDHEDLRRLVARTSKGGALPLSLAVEGTFGPHDGMLDMNEMKIGGSRARGRLRWRSAEAEGGGENTSSGLDFVLEVEAPLIDLDELGIARRMSRDASLAWSVRPFEALVPASWSGEGRFSAAAIRLRDQDLHDLLAEGTLHDGRLDLTTFRLAGLGGGLSATGHLGLGTRREIALTLTAKEFETRRLLSFVAAPGVLAGKLDGELAFSGVGESAYDLVSHLEGHGTAVWKQPALIGVDLDALAEELARLADAGQPIAAASLATMFARALKRGRTDFSDSRFDVAISQGIARIGTLRLASRESRLEAGLSLDLPALRIEGEGNVRLLTLVSKAPALSFRLEGGLEAPDVRWNGAALRRWLIRRLAQRVLPRLPLPSPDDPTLAPPDILAPSPGKEAADTPSPLRSLFERALQRLRKRVEDERSPP